MSRLLDQIRNAALKRLSRPVSAGTAPSAAATGVDAGKVSSSSSLLVQAMQRSAQSGADAADPLGVSGKLQAELQSSALMAARAEADREAVVSAQERMAEEQQINTEVAKRIAAEEVAIEHARQRRAAEQSAEQAAHENAAELERLTRLEHEREQLEAAAEAAARNRARADAEVEAKARTLERQQLKTANVARQRAESERIALQRQKIRADAEAAAVSATRAREGAESETTQSMAGVANSTIVSGKTPRAPGHHLPRLAVAAMAVMSVFGLGYWTGLPDPGAPGNAPEVHAQLPSVLELRFDRDLDGLSRRLGKGHDREVKNK